MRTEQKKEDLDSAEHDNTLRCLYTPAGNRVVALSAWLHCGLGQTLQHIVDVFHCHLHFQLTPGGLVQQWYRLQEAF